MRFLITGLLLLPITAFACGDSMVSSRVMPTVLATSAFVALLLLVLAPIAAVLSSPALRPGRLTWLLQGCSVIAIILGFVVLASSGHRDVWEGVGVIGMMVGLAMPVLVWFSLACRLHFGRADQGE